MRRFIDKKIKNETGVASRKVIIFA